MPIVNVVLILIVVGVLLWLVNNYIPMEAMMKKLLNIVVVVAVVIWLLRVFNLLHYITSVRI